MHFSLDKKLDQLQGFSGMDCRLRNSETESAQSSGLPALAAGNIGNAKFVWICRLAAKTEEVRQSPTPEECRASRKKSVDRIPFLVRRHTRRRDPTDPVHSAFPGANSVGIVHADRSISFND